MISWSVVKPCRPSPLLFAGNYALLLPELLTNSRPCSWTAWAEKGFELDVREVASGEFSGYAGTPGVVAVRDEGFTEVAPDSLTVLAFAGQ